LDYAHNPAAVHPEITRPVIHRDIKPENILIGRDGRGVQIVVFGLAAQVRISLSRTSQVEMDSVGTLPYMAPEQWRGQYQDVKTDQYALGVVAYELLADRLPFETADPVQLRECVLHDPVPPIRGQTPQVNAVLARAMAKAREDRWPTCGALVDALPRQPALLVTPFSASAARTAQDAWAAHLGQPVEFELSPGLQFRLIPPGEFLMGSTEADLEKLLRMYPNAKREWYTPELPQHRVRITRPFWLARCQLTRGQFAAFVRDTGYKTEGEADGKGGWSWNDSTGKWEQDPKITWRTPGFDQTDEHPVLVVSWNDAKAYCAWLSKRTGKTVRLPTEAEWEFACRAGTTTWYYSGDDPETLAKVGNVADGTLKRHFPKWQWETISAEDGYVFTAPVGKFQPNAFGLYDMHGNAWDWTEDRHSSDYYQQVARSIVEDPTGPPSGSSRVVRGGSWYNHAGYCRSAFRYLFHPSSRNHFIGFRLVVSWG
jgi:formylglycine-generating enzyme required for sulfatase activity